MTSHCLISRNRFGSGKFGLRTLSAWRKIRHSHSRRGNGSGGLRGQRRGRRGSCRKRRARCNRCHSPCSARELRFRDHGAFRIQQVHVIGSEPQTDQSTRIGNALVLPALVSLIATHSLLGGVIPFARGLAGHVVLANQRGLDLPSAPAVNGLLPTRLTRPLTAVM